MTNVLSLRKEPVTVQIRGYWSGPVFTFEITSTALPEDDPRIGVTFTFDGAVRQAYEYAERIGLEGVRFSLTCEDMHGAVA